MMFSKFVFLALILLFLLPLASAVENCCNSIDDDSDGRENGEDSECTVDVSLSGGSNSVCWASRWDNYVNYSNYWSGTFSCPPGKLVTSVNYNIYMETCCDYFKIYDGTGLTELFRDNGGITGTVRSEDLTSHAQNSIKFRFQSDYSVTRDGVRVNSITCSNDPPIANADGPYNIILPNTSIILDGYNTIDAEDCPSGGGCISLGYTWDIDPGNNPANCAPLTLLGAAPSVICTTEGVSNLTLTATDSSGGSHTSPLTTITVLPIGTTPPVSNVGGPYTITLPSPVVDLDGSMSYDSEDCPSGGSSCESLNYDWSITDASNFANCFPLTENRVLTSGIYCDTVGTSIVKLTVTDSDGATATDSTTITVLPVPNAPPVANPGGPYEITFPAQQIDLDGSMSYDSEDCPSAPCPFLTYHWSINPGNNFANCNPLTIDGVTATVNCTNAGTSEMFLTVTDSEGDSDISSVIITVFSNFIPTPNAGGPYGPYAVSSPSTYVTLDGSNSYDSDDCPSAPCYGLIYDWSIDPGNNLASCALTVTSGILTNADCFTTGTSNLTLTVTDSDGATATDSTTIIIFDPSLVSDFEIVSLDVSPKNLFLPSGGSDTVFVTVEARNIIGISSTIQVDFEVFDSEGISKFVNSIGGIEVTGTPTTFAPQLITVDEATWPNGTYLVRVKVIDPSSGEVQGTSEKFFTLTTDPAATTFVPELDFVVLPILALAVLAVLFFRGKEKC